MILGRLQRRTFLGGIAGAAVASPGCTGSGDPDIRLEFEATVDKEPEMVPEDIRDIHRGSDNPDGRRQEGNKWVVIEIFVEEGNLDMEDIWFYSRIETEDRFYDLDHASGELADGIQSRGEIQDGGYGIALYQIPEESELNSWNLEETRQDIVAEER